MSKLSEFDLRVSLIYRTYNFRIVWPWQQQQLCMIKNGSTIQGFTSCFFKKTKKELVWCNFTQLKTPTSETKQIPILNNKTMLIIYHKVRRRYFWNFKPTSTCLMRWNIYNIYDYTLNLFMIFFFTYLRWGYTYNITEAYPKSAALNAKREKLVGKLNCKKGPFQLKLLLADLISLWDCHDDIDILLGVLFFPYSIPWLIFRVGKRTLRFLLKKCI